jgi:hypothetical protein
MNFRNYQKKGKLGMAEEKIVCPKCGTENSTDDKYCKECGTLLLEETNKEDKTEHKTTKTKTWQSPELVPFIVELIFFVILFVAIFFAKINDFSSFFEGKYNVSEAETIFQQIYYTVSNTEICLRMLIVAIFTILVILIVLVIWSVFKFNRIERRIVETQEMINKRG